MKLKGTKPIEQHIEKIVLVVVLGAFLAAVSMQFLLQPNAVEISSSRSVAPEQVYTELEGEAQRIESQLRDLQPQLPQVASTDLVARYNEAFANASGSSMQLSAALGQGIDIEQAFGGTVHAPIGGGTENVEALAVPVTSKPIALSSWATLDPFVLQEVPEYSRYVPSAQPHDFASVSIEATFNGQSLRAALEGEDGEGLIPRKFWVATGVTILGFEVERQQMMENGQWGESEPIETPPMTSLPVRSITADDGLPQLTELVRNASGAFVDVVHPMFPPTIAGVEWTPPSERVAEDSGSLSKADKMRKRLAGKDRELARLEGRSTTTRPSQRPGGGGGKTSTQSDPRQTRPSTGTDRNRVKIQRLKDEIQKIQEELREMGEDVDADDRSSGTKTAVAVLDAEDIQLWAHDLGVEPGAQYRYRSRVVVNNPLFRKGPAFDADDEAKQALTKDPFSRGAWSSWSDTVLVGAEEYFFVGSAEPVGIHGESPRASVEVFKMFYGHYRRSTIAAQPGMKLQANARVSGWMVTIDTEAMQATEAAEQLALLQEDDDAELPEGFREVPRRLMIDLGVYLLEIALDPVSTETDASGNAVSVAQVILRDADGGLIVQRSVSSKASSPAYKLVSESASRASKALMRVSEQSAVSPSYELFPDASEP